jgi:chitinase
MGAFQKWWRRFLQPRPVSRRARLQLETLEGREVPAVVADFAITQDWGSGFEGRIRLTNNDPTPVQNWSLDFDYNANITSLWDGQVVSHSGTHYVVSNAGWNKDIPAGGTVSFGFVAAPGSPNTPPSNYVVNGVPLGGGGGTNPPPALPTISVADVSMMEGTGGTSKAIFTFTLSTPSTKRVTVAYATANGTALAGSDYTAKSGTVTFNPGETQKTVAVKVTPDSVVEPDETFTLQLTNPRNATLARTQATATLMNDDGTPANRPPTALNDFAATRVDEPVRINVLANDTDPDGDPLAITGVSGGRDGSVTTNSDGTLTFTPNSGFSGSTSFSYSVGDGKGGTASAQVTVNVSNPTASSWPEHVFAPYVDMTLWPTYDLVSAARNQNVKFFTLAFVVADGQGNPTWGGYSVYGLGSEFDQQMRTQIAGVRALGGDVLLSFGGAANRELALAITDVTALTNAYQSVIDAYQLTHIDFDIEGYAVADRASIDRRSQAIARLQQNADAAGKELEVWYTLPVLPTGLTPDGVYVLESAVRHGVRIGGVNIMAMDYGDSAAPNPSGKMGDYAIQAANSLFGQLRTLYGTTRTDAELWQLVGVTPMIGLNDVTTEVFDQQEARELLAFAREKGLGMLSFWSLARDQQHPNGKISYVDLKSSSILQEPFEFTTIFGVFTS